MNTPQESAIAHAKMRAIEANTVNMEIGQCMLDIEANNKQNAEFPLQFIAFAEKIKGKLDDSENQLLSLLTQKVLLYQKATTENFKLILELANNQRIRTENAIKNYEEVAKQ